ncbi:MAG: hypothetical protein Q4F82_00310 [bacterium]|nr:hypothetical protein [bacterium]
MRKTLLLFLFALGGIYAMAQEPYYCTTKGAVLTYTDYDAKGKENGSTVHTFKEVTGKDGNFDIIMESTVNAAGVVNKTEVKVQIRNGSAQIGMGDGTIDVTVSDPELFDIPNHLAVGMKLPLGEAIANIGGFRVKSTITENEVIDREEITTPAGTFKCYVVKQTSSGRVMGIKSESTIKSWYARGIGVVKSETYGNGKLSSSSVLTSIEK